MRRGYLWRVRFRPLGSHERSERRVPNPPDDEPPAPRLEVVTDRYQRPPKKTRSRKKQIPRPPSLRDRWIENVERSPLITDSVRCLLLTLALHYMDEDGYTEVHQEEICARIGKQKRRLFDRYQGAIAAGFLVEVKRGGSGGAVGYQAEFPRWQQSTMRDKQASNM